MAEATPAKPTLADVPPHSELPGGDAVLCEASAFRVLEGGPLIHFGGVVSPQTVRLVRSKPGPGRVNFKLVVEPKESSHGGERIELPLDARASLAPAKLKGLRHGKHVVKPEGVGLAKAVLESLGDDIDLVIIQVKRRPPHPLVALFRRGPNSVALGFKDHDEARGWYLYLSAVLGVVDEADGKTFDAMCAKSAAGHQAATLGELFSAAA